MDWTKATPSSEIKPGDSYYFESDETTHFSILDDQGNAVSVTTTLNGAYGSKVFIDKIGVFMNNENGTILAVNPGLQICLD